MNTLIDQAVKNNIAWCEIVCDSHGVAHTSKEHLWGVFSKAPKYYPELITKSKYSSVEDINNYINKVTVSSIKDSFANLNLSPLGFEILFNAKWIFHEGVHDSRSLHDKWRVINTEKDLKKWTISSGLVDIIKPDILNENSVKIFMYEQNNAVCGFIANLSANVVGVSNVFTTDHANEELWLDIPDIISTEFPGFPIVGYEHNENLIAANSAGWRSIGSLRVWIRSNH
ncbi:hypothetical protein [Chengkuizengella axinellae]|uniref:Uncharacterized protein n=1 Tax=Chengkuizengella axinellae TaxID=3064388 RepID=A0ABT9J6U1_9BACL|nr:hypothetical protein [Chengkuizengella sp. 2205SS18-9]MDP5277187.1 hypothetical protein [Chengkuizengella sp. 2205SS18-9]